MTTWLLVAIALVIAVTVRPLDLIGGAIALCGRALWFGLILAALLLAFRPG